MKILALDTSTSVATVAVIDDNRLLGEFFINHKKTHSQKLMPMVKRIMDELEIIPQEIDIFASSTGPGSFTGLRIGVTTVKAIAYAADRPVVSVPTLDALAYNILMGNCMVCPIMDARNKQVYTALYRCKDDCMERITEYLGIPVDDLIQLIKEKNEKVVFVGDAVEIYREYFKGILGGLSAFAPGNVCFPRASSVAYIAHKMASEGSSQNSYEMIPFYLRKSQAEREYENKLCKDSCG